MLSFQEIKIAIEVGMIYGILAIGIYLTFRTINFPDLTCDGSFVFGAAISSVIIKNGYVPTFGIIGALLAGGAAGLATGLLHVKLKIDKLLSGIIVAFMLYSVNLRVMGANPNISLVGMQTIFYDSESIIAFLTLFIVFLLISLAYLFSSDFGLGLRTVGMNKPFAAANGVNVNFMVIFGLMLSNALVGLCGAIFTQYQGFCDASQGVGCLIIGLTSVIIGEKSLGKSVDKILFGGIALRNFERLFIILATCVIGSIAYRIFIAIAINSDIFGLKTQDFNFVTGLLTIFVMGRKKCFR